MGQSCCFESSFSSPHPLFHINSHSHLRFLWKPIRSLNYLHYGTYFLYQNFLCVYQSLALILFLTGSTLLGVWYVELGRNSLVFSRIKLFSMLFVQNILHTWKVLSYLFTCLSLSYSTQFKSLREAFFRPQEMVFFAFFQTFQMARVFEHSTE